MRLHKPRSLGQSRGAQLRKDVVRRGGRGHPHNLSTLPSETEGRGMAMSPDGCRIPSVEQDGRGRSRLAAFRVVIAVASARRAYPVFTSLDFLVRHWAAAHPTLQDNIAEKCARTFHEDPGYRLWVRQFCAAWRTFPARGSQICPSNPVFYRTRVPSPRRRPAPGLGSGTPNRT